MNVFTMTSPDATSVPLSELNVVNRIYRFIAPFLLQSLGLSTCPYGGREFWVIGKNSYLTLLRRLFFVFWFRNRTVCRQKDVPLNFCSFFPEK
jgi:hypothetical protein